MLMLMKSQTEAMRALAGVVAVSLDAAHLHPDMGTRARHQAFADLMIPVVKGWCTENSIEIASLGIQIHGGMGFIEETGVAQQLRDARITTIYEGTTGIQANDLLGRKLGRDSGSAAQAFIAELQGLSPELAKSARFSSTAAVYSAAIEALQRSVEYAVSNFGKDGGGVSVGAVPLLKLMGITAGGWALLRSGLIAEKRLESPGQTGVPDSFHRSKIESALFYAHYLMAQAPGLAHSIRQGGNAAMAESALSAL